MSGCCSCAESSSDAGPPVGDWVRLGLAGVVAAQSMIFGLAINISPPSGSARAVLHGALALSAVAVFLLAGLPLARRSWRALCSGRIVFDQLFLLGIFAAFGASIHCTLTGVGHVYYEIVAILLAIYTFGGLITESRRREVFSAAGDLGSEFSVCEVLDPDGSSKLVSATTIQPGDLVWVRAGGAICIDGIVEEGISFVQESALTGEPFPVVKRPGDEVAAGCYALEGGMKVRIQNSGRGLDRLLHALEEARARPSRLQRQADKLATWFLPAILIIATGTFAWWTIDSGWQTGLFNALAVILVACPCAMGIATPVAIWSSLAAFAKCGLRPKDADFVEKLASITTAVFDKTGTLGEEAMEVVDFVAAEGFDRSDLRRMVAALENASEHPIARAFRNFGDASSPEGTVRLLPGAGIEGRVDGHLLRIGNAGVLERNACQGLKHLQDQIHANGDATREIFIVLDGRLAAVAKLRETLRSGALEALSNFEALGIRCEVMTGDRLESAEIHGLPNIRAGLSPTDKARLVRELEEKGERVLFIGDGINDSAAMLEAHAAVAIRSGTAIAIEASDGVLQGQNLRSLPDAVAKGRQAVRTIRSNLLFAACYNAVAVSLAAIGLLHPVAAALIMLASSFTVTWRALGEASETSEIPAQPKPAAVNRPNPWAPAFPGWTVAASACAILLQGLVLSWLGSLPLQTTVGMSLLFFGAAVGIYCLCMMRPLGAESLGGLLMFSVGGLAMLGGWWADAGFLPVVRDGVCLCNCSNSTMGLGIFAKPNWMAASMLLASAPMLFLGLEQGSRPGRWICWVAGFFGMLLGMQGAAWLASFLPTQNPQMNFFAGYGSMLFGMALGMMLACHLSRKFLIPTTGSNPDKPCQ